MKRRNGTGDPIMSHIRHSGYKVTHQRELLSGAFLKFDHVSVENLHREILKKDPGIGYITVYRFLKLLCHLGLAQERHFGSEKTVYDNILWKEHHDHLICIRCGRIVEFSSDEIEKLQLKIAKKRGFFITHHKLEISGICMKCRKD